MKIISRNDILALNIAPRQWVQWVTEAFALKNRCQLPAKISLHPHGTDFINTMPCLLPEEFHTFGCKVVSRVEGAHPACQSQLMVVDTLSGAMTALINADEITAMRTGAVATLAIEALAVSTMRVLGFVGLGAMAHATLRCLADVLPANRQFTIRLKRYKRQAEETAAMFAGVSNFHFEIVDTMEQLVDGADVVVSCITSASELLVPDASLFKPGVLVVPVHTRGFQNCDTIFDRVIADDTDHVRGFRFFAEFRNFAELADVLHSPVAGRQADSERILSYNIGLGLHDIYCGYKILQMLK